MPFVLQPRRLNVRKTIFVATVIIGLIIWMVVRDAPAPDKLSWQGFTMGTTYSIKALNSGLGIKEFMDLRDDIQTLLEDLNDQMSTYRDQSEISRFNRSQSTGPFTVSDALGKVTRAALQLSEESGGAFDPTLDPLINLWGFGNRKPSGRLPINTEIAEMQKHICFQYLKSPSPTQIQKALPGLQINLNAIAKGYTVDVVSELLFNRGLHNTFVEIGGEIYTRGLGPGEKPWSIGLEAPNPHALPGESLTTTIFLQNKAVATSGNYRNFILDEDGNTLSHILDPRTGRPVEHRLASVSVVAETCVLADGIATALFVMGDVDGLKWVESYPDVEALFISVEQDGSFVQSSSSGFASYRTNTILELK